MCRSGLEFSMRTVVAVCLAALGLLALSGGSVAHAVAPGERAACTVKQKKQRLHAIAAYLKRMPKDRATYFRRHRSKKPRARFVRRQRAHLKALRSARARCSKGPVTPVPKADPPLTSSAAGFNEVTDRRTVRNAGPAA